MENTKIKELKDDAILEIKVNKSFYLMSKAGLLTILQELNQSSELNLEVFVKSIISKKYEDMNDKERTFYTLTLLVGEIEKQAVETKSYIEKEINVDQLKKDIETSNED